VAWGRAWADRIDPLRSLNDLGKAEYDFGANPTTCAPTSATGAHAHPSATTTGANPHPSPPPASREPNDQPSLYRQLKKLPWRQIETAHSDTCHGHGRIERRSLKVCSLSDQPGQGLLFPHAAQAICITRKTRPRHGGRWKTVTVYAVTSLDAHQARPAELAAWIRRHWQIEALHHIRDVTYREDASQIRTGTRPAVMAALRNLAIGILKTAGHASIAAACRHHARDATRTLETLRLDPA
jgi:hypothetical protein